MASEITGRRSERIVQVGPADLLAFGFAISAHLANKLERRRVVELYDPLWAASTRRTIAEAQHVEQRTMMTVAGLNNFNDLKGPGGILLAVAQLGPFFIGAALIGQTGIKVATVFWNMPEAHRRLLTSSGVLLLQLTTRSTLRRLCADICSLIEHGYVVFLLIETPMKSRLKFDFFGYDACCSSLVDIVAKICLVKINRLYCTFEPGNCLKLHVMPPIITNNTVQTLIHWAETLALDNLEQYNWSEASIIFSDPSAYNNGLSFLPEIVAWRNYKLRG